MKVVFLVGTVYGAAKSLADYCVAYLAAQDLTALCLPEMTVTDLHASTPEMLVCVTATTGAGDIPEQLYPLYCSLRDTLPPMQGMPSAVIALGDSSYADTFCAAGEQMHTLFAELGMLEVLPMLRIDASETVDFEAAAEPWLAALVAQIKEHL